MDAFSDILARIPPLWYLTLGLALYTVTTAAHHRRAQDAWLMGTMLFACVVCVIYLCVTGGGI